MNCEIQNLFFYLFFFFDVYCRLVELICSTGTLLMALDPRSKRIMKQKKIYSPSDPLKPEYHLIHVPELEKDFIAKTSSVKQQSNGLVSIVVGGKEKRGDLITSGK